MATASAPGETTVDTDLARLLLDAFLPGGPEAVWRLEPLLRDAVRSGVLRSVVERHLRDPQSRYRVVPILTESLVREGGLRVSLILIKPGQVSAVSMATGTLRDHAENGLIVNASDSALRLRVFRQPDLTDRDVLDQRKALLLKGDVTLGRSDIMYVRAGETILDFLDVDRPTVICAAFGPAVWPVSWGYDPRSLEPVRLYSSTLKVTRVRYALEAAHVLAKRWQPVPGSLVDAVEALTKHESHVVRWSSLRTLDGMDRKRGERALFAALRDPHPHVASVAREALDL